MILKKFPTCRVSEVINLTPNDIDEHKLILQKSKSGIRGEVVYIPRKLQRRLTDYIRDNEIEADERVFPISYSTSWSMVKKAGQIVGTNLRPHDLRRHAATYASRTGTPLEIVSKVILRHADLTSTQRILCFDLNITTHISTSNLPLSCKCVRLVG